MSLWPLKRIDKAQHNSSPILCCSIQATEVGSCVREWSVLNQVCRGLKCRCVALSLMCLGNFSTGHSLCRAGLGKCACTWHLPWGWHLGLLWKGQQVLVDGQCGDSWNCANLFFPFVTLSPRASRGFYRTFTAAKKELVNISEAFGFASFGLFLCSFFRNYYLEKYF